MNRFAQFLIFVFFCMSCRVGYSEKSCGKASIVSGASCSTLKVRFNLEECGGKNNEEAQIECETNRANALVITEEHTYHIPAREIAPGVWTLVGTVREYPKKWRPENNSRGPIAFRAARPADTGSSWPAVFEVSGQFRFRVEENRKNNFLSNRGFSSMRARAGLGFHPNDSVQFLIQPQACQLFGEPVLQPATSSVNVPVATSGANKDPYLNFHQAFGEVHPLQMWRLIVGRQTLAFGDEVLVGASDWENPGRSFDGVRSRLEWGHGAWDLFSTKLWDSNTVNAGTGDQDFHGTYLSWTHPNQSVSLSPYLFWLRDQRSSLSQLFTSGFHLRLNLNDIEVGAEASGQWGETNGQQAWGEIKSKPITSLGFRVSLDGFWSSPDFNPLFPSTHKWLGWADVLGRRNLSGLGFQLGLPGSANSELTIRGLHFLKTSTEYPAYQLDATTPVNHVTSKSQVLGSEIDISLKSMVLPSVELLAAASVFLPTEELKQGLSEPWLGRFEVSLVSNF